MSDCTHDCSSCGESCGERTAPQDFRAPANGLSHIGKVIAVVSGKGGVGKSLGLGLSLCRSIVQAHGGSITVEDNYPKGAIFSFTLPLAEVNTDEQTSNLDH